MRGQDFTRITEVEMEMCITFENKLHHLINCGKQLIVDSASCNEVLRFMHLSQSEVLTHIHLP